jgi:molybdate transport system permease protein
MSDRGRQRPPLLIVLLAAGGIALFVVPLIGIVTRVPWGDLWEILGSAVVRDALRLSLLTSVVAAAISALFGIPLAWVLARVPFRGKAIARALVLLPMVLPPVVGGAALLFALGRRGALGEPLYDLTGIVLPFSIWAVIIANTLIAMPFMVITIEAALRGADPRYEAAAASLGAGRWTVLWRVTLPLIRPAIIAGVVLTWARALGEFGATITFAGNLQGRTQTLPIAVFVALERDRDVAVAISLVLIAVSFAVLIGLRDRWWRVL